MRKVHLNNFMWGIGILALIFLLSPFVVVLPNGLSSGAYLQFPTPGVSTRWLLNFLANKSWTDAAATSFQVALGASILATLFGGAAALALDGWDFPAKALIVVLLLSPLVIPAVIVGIAAYTLFVAIHLYGSLGALIVADSVLGVPYVLLSVSAALNQQDPRVRMAAQSLGAGPGQVFREVTLPLALPGFLAGAILAFVISFDDLVIATFLAGIRTTTLPMRMFQAVQAELDPTIAAVSTLLMLFAAVVLVALQALAVMQRRTASSRATHSVPRGGIV